MFDINNLSTDARAMIKMVLFAYLYPHIQSLGWFMAITLFVLSLYAHEGG